MDELRFDGQVAIVTGAGRGIGRAYARLFAARGASVVVNDLGSSMAGVGVDSAPATDAVDEIRAGGGTAIADGHDISTADGADALIGRALDEFGRLDILVNNAGIMRWAQLPELSTADFEAHFAVHTLGSFNTARAAWPTMIAQGYGRIVMTASAGMLGLPNNTAYASAKGGVVGLARSLAHTGGPHGIKVNVIAPAAVTRMAGRQAMESGDMGMPPDAVAPLVAYLAHDDCPVSGEIYAAGAGRFSRLFIASTPGHLVTGRAPVVEDVVEHWAEINAEAGYHVPTGLFDWSATFAAHLYGAE